MIAGHFLFVFCVLAGSTRVKADAPSAWLKEGIVPDVLDNPPNSTLGITYPLGLKVNLGSEQTPTQVRQEPEVTWDADPDKFYTLLMTHPDAPSRRNPVLREFKHWLVINIPGNNLTAGELLFQYRRPGPAEGSDLHRYIFLVYEQPEKLNWDEPTDPDANKLLLRNRIKFSTKAFAKRFNLGEPITGNFFLTEWDESVPRLHEQFAEFRANATSDLVELQKLLRSSSKQ